MDKRKVILVVIGVLILIVGTFGITASLFSTGSIQTGLNSFKSGCLNITIEDESAALSLSKSYPITDIEGIESTPYTFTIRNTCSTPTNYQINLESINEVANTLNGDYVKVSLSSDTMDNVISTLTSNTAITPSLDNAYAAYNLYTGVLEGNSSKTYNLKEWIEYNATIEQAANKVYESRISVIANPDLTVTEKADLKFNINDGTVTGTITGNANTAKYCITENGICIPSTNTTITNKTITIEVEDRSSDKIVCANLDNGKVVCSNKIPKVEYCPEGAEGCKTILAETKPKTCSNSFTGTSTTDEGICTNEDDDGTTYYFRGNVTNNWVQFAGFYWRIIRINGDGSIRIIYNGTSTTTTGDTTQLGTKAFNSTYNSAEYVGIKYTMGSQHGTGTNSTILGTSDSTDATTLNGWYNSKIKGTQYEKYVETNGKFCSDRNVASGHSSYPGTTGTGTTATLFAPADRLLTANLSSWKTTQTPTLKCTSASDRLTMPVGLITSDEVVFAGGFGGTANSSYYLYTNKAYWTMSPSNFDGSNARVFRVNSGGNLGSGNVVYSTLDVRPVINLASDVKLTGSGTTSSPYTVS